MLRFAILLLLLLLLFLSNTDRVRRSVRVRGPVRLLAAAAIADAGIGARAVCIRRDGDPCVCSSSSSLVGSFVVVKYHSRSRSVSSSSWHSIGCTTLSVSFSRPVHVLTLLLVLLLLELLLFPPPLFVCDSDLVRVRLLPPPPSTVSIDPSLYRVVPDLSLPLYMSFRSCSSSSSSYSYSY